MTYSREGALAGEEVVLRAVFVDDADNFVDTDALPDVYIYDGSVGTDIIDDEIDTSTFSSALSGPHTPTKISTGFYEYAYTIPSGSDEGVWHDVWNADLNTVDVTSRLSFQVETGADLGDQDLANNQLVVIELDSTVKNTDGDKTLGEDQVLSFSTVYKPLYASPTLLRIEGGAWLNELPDDTLAMLLHLSSLEADYISPNKRGKDAKVAFAKFVVYDAMMKIVNLPGGLSGVVGGNAAGGRKSLGNLRIQRGSSSIATNSAGIDKETLGYIRDMREEWWRVVNSGATIVPGESFSPEYAVRGIRRITGRRKNAGRLWKKNNQHQQVANSKQKDFLYELARFQSRDDDDWYDR